MEWADTFVSNCMYNLYHTQRNNHRASCIEFLYQRKMKQSAFDREVYLSSARTCAQVHLTPNPLFRSQLHTLVSRSSESSNPAVHPRFVDWRRQYRRQYRRHRRRRLDCDGSVNRSLNIRAETFRAINGDCSMFILRKRARVRR